MNGGTRIGLQHQQLLLAKNSLLHFFFNQINRKFANAILNTYEYDNTCSQSYLRLRIQIHYGGRAYSQNHSVGAAEERSGSCNCAAT